MRGLISLLVHATPRGDGMMGSARDCIACDSRGWCVSEREKERHSERGREGERERGSARERERESERERDGKALRFEHAPGIRSVLSEVVSKCRFGHSLFQVLK